MKIDKKIVFCSKEHINITRYITAKREVKLTLLVSALNKKTFFSILTNPLLLTHKI